MTVADVAVPGADDSHAGFCMAMSSRVTSKVGSVSLFTAASRRLRVKRVPCVLITIPVGQHVNVGGMGGTGLTQSARIEYSQLSRCVSRRHVGLSRE